MTKNPKWGEYDTKTLTALWEAGMAASAIGKEMGRTRNSIIGRAHRLGLSRRGKTLLKADGRSKAIRKRKPKAPKQVKLWVKPRPPAPWRQKETVIVKPDGSKKVSLLQVRDYQCRAIVEYADGKLEGAICCGEAVTVNRYTGQPISWCAYHHSIYFEPPKEGRDGRRPVAPNWSPRGNPPVHRDQKATTKAA